MYFSVTAGVAEFDNNRASAEPPAPVTKGPSQHWPVFIYQKTCLVSTNSIWYQSSEPLWLSWLERWSHNPKVASSSLARGTVFFLSFLHVWPSNCLTTAYTCNHSFFCPLNWCIFVRFWILFALVGPNEPLRREVRHCRL